MSIKSQYKADSSTRTQTRQLDQDQQQFARLVADTRKTLTIPPDEQIDKAGALAQQFRELIADFQDNGLNGFNDTLQVMSRTNRRIMAVITWLEDQDQQTEQGEKDARLTTGKKGKPVFKTLSMSDLKKLPPAKWILPKIWQQVGTSLTYGDANTGKTFVDLDIALHFAYGMDWQGRALPRLRVLYIFGEGDVGLAARVEAWQKFHDKPDTDYIQFICFPVQLMSECPILCATIEDQEEVPGLIVLDTFSVCAEGIPENDNTEVARFLSHASYIKRMYKTHVHIIHHAGKGGDYRGAAAFRGNVDTMTLLSREDNTAPIVMSCKKQKDAEYFADIYLQLEQVSLGLDTDSLEEISSCVVISANAPIKTEVMPAARQKMLEILELNGRMTYGTWKKACVEAQIIKDTAFYNHVKAMVDSKQVLRDQPEEGKGKHVWYSLSPSSSSPSSQSSSPELANQGQN